MNKYVKIFAAVAFGVIVVEALNLVSEIFINSIPASVALAKLSDIGLMSAVFYAVVFKVDKNKV